MAASDNGPEVSDSDWSNAGNWELGVPESTNNVVIRNVTNAPHVNTTGAVCNNLTIYPSASLTIDAGQALTINSALANNGLLTIESSEVNSSGSLIVNGTSAGNVTYNRIMPGSAWHYISSPVSLTSPPSGFFYAWNEVAGNWNPGSTVTPVSGIGYTLQTIGNSISFTGSLVSEDFEINATSPYRYNDYITGSEHNYDSRSFVQSTDGSHSGAITRSLTNYGGGGWNLLGNPYTSAMSVSAFIDENYKITPANSQFDPNYVALYLYNGSTYRYVAKSTGWPGGDYLNENYIQTGQGFFVLAMNDNSTYTFKRSMQGHDTDVSLLKSAKVESRWPGLQLKVSFGENENCTTIVFDESMTLGLDPGYDVGLMSYGPGAGIYTALVGGQRY